MQMMIKRILYGGLKVMNELPFDKVKVKSIFTNNHVILDHNTTLSFWDS